LLHFSFQVTTSQMCQIMQWSASNSADQSQQTAMILTFAVISEASILLLLIFSSQMSFLHQCSVKCDKPLSGTAPAAASVCCCAHKKHSMGTPSHGLKPCHSIGIASACSFLLAQVVQWHREVIPLCGSRFDSRRQHLALELGVQVVTECIACSRLGGSLV